MSGREAGERLTDRYERHGMDLLALSVWCDAHITGPDANEAYRCCESLFEDSDNETRDFYRADWSLLCADAFGASDLDVVVSL